MAKATKNTRAQLSKSREKISDLPIDNIDINKILSDKSIKTKEKVTSLSQLLIDNKISIQYLIDTAKTSADTDRATVIESMEHASRLKAEVIDQTGFQFVISTLKSDAPRVKWESARVIANTAHLFHNLQKKALPNLLENTEHPGNVVRWSAAGALSKIIQCKTNLNKELVPVIEAIERRERDSAIKKIYQKALKAAAK